MAPAPFGNREGEPARVATTRRGFSLIELIVAIGVVLVLVGLFLPAVAGSMAKARTTGQLAAVQQTAVIVEMYLRDSGEVYPLAHTPNAVQAGWRYLEPIVASGLLSSPQDLGEGAFSRTGAGGHKGSLNILLSENLVCDWEEFRPGRTHPEEQRPARAVRASEVVLPSAKGSLSVGEITDGHAVGLWCCIAGSPPGPVGFCDGSVGMYRWEELLPKGEKLFVENGAGFPVGTTWSGFRGRDRQ